MGNICLNNMDARRQMDFHFKLLQANTESWSSQVQRSESVRLELGLGLGLCLDTKESFQGSL